MPRISNEDVKKWIETLLTSEPCKECAKGFLYRFKTAYWCSVKECKYGTKADGKYKGAAYEITGARLELRGSKNII